MTAILRVLVLALATLLPASAGATTIERVVSPGGIEAWLVRDGTNPMIAMDFTFRGGGNSQDRAGREGTAYLLTTMLDEGAGPLDSNAFQQRMQRLAMSLSFSHTRDTFSGAFRTLTVNRDAAFDMVRLALAEPHFANDALERMRAAGLAAVRREQGQPNTVAARAFSAAAFPNHPYGRPSNGTPETLAVVTRDDLAAFHRRVMARDNLIVAVVGDIDAATLAPLLDRVFGALPARAELTPVPPVVPGARGTRIVVPLEIPQTIIQFGLPGVSRTDPDFFAAFVLNHIVGGGSFTSRLWDEVRERRGLTYGIGTGLTILDRSALWAGSTSTRNDRAAETLQTIEAVIRRVAEEGPTQDELDKAKSFLTGSYLLRFDTSQRIASELVGIRLSDWPIDWISRRNDVVNAVTLEDVRRIARRMLAGEMLVTLVGRPQGVTPRVAGGG